jgi:type II secretory pathway pseudopilin PulG
MKRARTRHHLVLDLPLPLVGQQGSVFMSQTFAGFLKAGLKKFRRKGGIHMMLGDFKQTSFEEPAFQGGGNAVRQGTFRGRGPQNSKSGLRRGQIDSDIQRMFFRPGQERLGGISPAQAEGRCQWRLRGGEATAQKGEGDKSQHEESMHVSASLRKKTSGRRGMVLLEATIALSIITVIGLVLLKLSINILHPRQWILQQTLSDAYMTYERAFAERIPLEELKGSSSEWPQFPTTFTEQVELGRTPGGNPVYGTVVRTRIPDENNFPTNGGTGNTETNPAALEIWRVQSVLTYQVGERRYAKSRTVIRTQ